jgi:hypothetical protein
MRSVGGSLVLAAAALALSAHAAAGQGYRGWTSSNVRYVGMRPVTQESVARDLVVEGADGLTYQGHPVFCLSGASCTYFAALDTEHAFTGSQDVGVTAWGLGLQGLSFTALVRARARIGGDFIWPRSDDDFDAMLAYAQLDRGRLRARLGRQENLSGLGFRGYDGASVAMEVLPELSVEGYGGRSLVRGLNEPRQEALKGLVDFFPNRDAWIVGASANVRLDGRTSADLQYQREILDDRSGLLSERASLDVRTGVFEPVMVTASVDYDVAFDRMGKSHVTASYALPGPPVVVQLTGRRYVPYFDLSTIWGFFSPVPYHEVIVRGSWSGTAATAWLSGGARSYGETDTPVILSPLESDAWILEAGGVWPASERLTVEASYDLRWGVGAFLSSGEATVRFRPREDLDIAIQATSLQQFQEFRVGEGRIWGGGGTVGFIVSDRIRLDGGLSIFRHADEGRQIQDPWSQLRGWSALRLEFGSEPGTTGRRFRR